jgi:hypothetical protein
LSSDGEEMSVESDEEDNDEELVINDEVLLLCCCIGLLSDAKYPSSCFAG